MSLPHSGLATIIDVLRMRAERQPDRPAYRYLTDGEGTGTVYTYSDVDVRARAIAGFLQQRYTPGERILLLYQPGLEYISALFGCMYAGIIAVPAFPLSPTKIWKTNTRLHTIVQDCAPVASLVTRSWFDRSYTALTGDAVFAKMQWHATDDLDQGWAAKCQPFRLDPDQTAFLQYTSGSTSDPRGVMVSHQNIMHNEEIIRTSCEHSEASTFVGWLPFYHDMGLIGNILQPLYLGSQSVLLPPSAFLQKPARWLQAISTYRGATSGGPNFAYDYCVWRISDEERAALDLSSWTLAFNGAEPIRADTLESFARTFADCGFRRDALFPCYGLAESTLMVSASSTKKPFVVGVFDGEELQFGNAAPAVSSTEATKTLVSSGCPVQGLQVAIIDPNSRMPREQGTIGEIWVAGGSVAQGYWNRALETAETFYVQRADVPSPRYLRTGDLGFLSEGNLFVTGRLKDVIIIRGRNFYPQDIELTVERSHPALRPSGAAAFAMIAGEEDERLGIIAEVERAFTRQPLDDVLHAIRRAVVNEHEVEPHRIALIAAGHLLKTSSGKVRRSACRDAFQAGAIEPLADFIVEEPDLALEPDTSPVPADLPLTGNALVVFNHIHRVIGALLRDHAGSIDEHCRIGDLGLDSLRLIQLRHGLERLFDRTLDSSISLADLRIRDLVQMAQARVAELPIPQMFDNVQRSEPDHQALSIGQRGLWLLQQIAQENTAYNICRSLEIDGDVDVEALRSAFVHLYERHATLQSTFPVIGQGPVRQDRVSESWIEFEDVSFQNALAIASRFRAEAEHKFLLADGPLFRITILKQAPKKHIVILNLHHAVGDLWSIGILLKELLTSYSAVKSGLPIVLGDLPLTYSDYIHWQADLLASEAGKNHESYWAAQLSPPLEALHLPYDRPHPATPTFRGATYDFEVSAVLLERVKILSVNTRTTQFSCLLAAFYLLLYRSTRDRDIAVGVPCSGRSRAEFASIVGYFVNLAPVRIRLSDTQTVTDLIRSVHTEVQEAIAHQDYPFSSMVEKISGLRTPSGQPVINVLFASQNFPQAELDALAPMTMGLSGGQLQVGPLRLSTMALRQSGAQFDFGFFFAEHEHRLIASIEYNTSVFDEITIERLVNSFLTLLERIVEAPSACVEETTQLTSVERKQLDAWNDTATTYSEPSTLVGCIEAICEQSPAAEAVSDGGKTLTYGDLNASANRLARCLWHRGVEPEDVVAVCLNRSVELEVALLAILKAGAAYLPLDPSEPDARLRSMLEDSRAVLLITEQAMVERLAPAVSVLNMDSDTAAINIYEPTNLGFQPLPEGAAYVIYTSGSTGSPKGVVNTQAGIRNRLLWMQHRFQLQQGDRVLQKTPYTFDVSVWEFFWPLIAGAELVMARPEGHKDISYILDEVRTRQITTLHFVPSQLRLFLDEPDLRGLSLRRIICSGEALDQELQDRCLETLPGVELHNLYGPTEAAIDVTASQCLGGRPVSLGKPIANASVYVLDDKVNPVPVGVPGELCIGGIPLARGYLGRPDLTADRFVPHPIASQPGERIYRTGDRASWTADGTVIYGGRLDRQVKIRGARVELGEIESALRHIPGIQDAAVVFEQKPSALGELSAYIVVRSGDAKEWRNLLRQQLPEQMIPARFFSVDQFPLTPNGKRDLRKLQAMQSISSLDEGAGDLPRTPLEEQLVAIWAEVLNRNVRIHDNFFDLGGHSLLATQLISRIRDSLHCDIPVSLIFSTGSTVAQLAEAIENHLLQQAGEALSSALVNQVLTVSDEDLHAILNKQ